MLWVRPQPFQTHAMHESKLCGFRPQSASPEVDIVHKSEGQIYFYGMCSLVKVLLLMRYFSKEVRGSLQVPESDIVQTCRRLLDERQGPNVLQFLEGVYTVNLPTSFGLGVLLFGRRPDITEGLKRLKCRSLIIVGENSHFHAEALHMTSKLDRRFSALVKKNPTKIKNKEYRDTTLNGAMQEGEYKAVPQLQKTVPLAVWSVQPRRDASDT